MGVNILFEDKHIAFVNTFEEYNDYFTIRSLVSKITNIPEDDLYATQNGRPFHCASSLTSSVSVRWSARLVGGKGGFGSMLRAIGAQIEKTTNREACRDLSGRRLRDIRQEQRLREWAAQRGEREEDQRRRREERLNRMCATPGHEFSDPSYEEARRGLEEKCGEAVEVGLSKAQQQSSSQPGKGKPKGKKKKLWIDEDLSDMSSSESGCEEDEELKRKPAVSESSSTIPTATVGKGKGMGKKSQPESEETSRTSSDDGVATGGSDEEVSSKASN